MKVRFSTVQALSLTIVAITLVAITPSAQANNVTVYLDEADWLAAAGAVTLEDFNDDTFAMTITTDVGSRNAADNRWQDTVTDTQTTTFDFAQSIRAFAGTWFLTSLNGEEAGIALNYTIIQNGFAIDASLELPAHLDNQFYGFITDFDIDALQLTAGTQTPASADTFALDNVMFSPVPEPATIGLLVLGSLLTVRRQRATA